MTKIEITGCSSGLGRYLREELKASRIDRLGWPPAPKETDVIIHCAHGGNLEYTHDYIRKNIYLFEKLAEIKHKKFIFISSVDVYPKDKNLHTEDEVINPNDIVGIYGITKRAIEDYVMDRCRYNYLILRCGALLGKYTPRNNLQRASEGRQINILPNSSFNLINYEKVLEFIKRGIQNDWTGIYNIVASDNIKIKNLGGQGSGFKYKTPSISYEKLLKISPDLVQSSRENWDSWKANEY